MTTSLFSYAQKLPARDSGMSWSGSRGRLAIEDVLLMQMLEDLLDVDACTTARPQGFLLHAEMWFASHTDYAVLIVPARRRTAGDHCSCIGFLTGVGLNGSEFAIGMQSTSSRDVRVGVPRAMVSRSALVPALSAAEAVREATPTSPLGWKRVRHRHPNGRAGCRDLGGHQRCHRGRPWGAHPTTTSVRQPSRRLRTVMESLSNAWRKLWRRWAASVTAS